MIVHVGFTGTQNGMTLAQRTVFARVLDGIQLEESWLHHGDCIGADAEAHAIARRMGWKIHRHPPTNVVKRAFCDFDEDSQPAEYLARNHHIVEASSMVIATPLTATAITRSGTWATVKYAGNSRKEYGIIEPNGALRHKI